MVQTSSYLSLLRHALFHKLVISYAQRVSLKILLAIARAKEINKMRMCNHIVLIKPDETPSDILAEICDECNIRPDEHFAFSAIVADDKLKINSLVPRDINPYSAAYVVNEIFVKNNHNNSRKSKARYVQPSLEQWLEIFRPMLFDMVNRAYPFYQKLFAKDELVSTLYLVIVKLYQKNYYLHKNLVYRAFLNELNMECRRLKHHQDDMSIDQPVQGDTDDDAPMTLKDQIVDPVSIDITQQLTTYTLKDYWEDTLEKIKKAMLSHMSHLSYERLLFQIEHKCIDNANAKLLQRLRIQYIPNYVPQNKGRNKGKNHDKND